MAAPVNFVLSERSLDERTELLSLEGDTSSAAAHNLRQRLATLVEERKARTIVDLSRVSFLDSAVVEALKAAGAQAERLGTRMIVVEPVDPMIARPLEVGRVDLTAELAPSLGDAARRLDLPAPALQPAIPAGPEAPPGHDHGRRRSFGRRRQDQAVLRELGELRRAVE